MPQGILDFAFSNNTHLFKASVHAISQEQFSNKWSIDSPHQLSQVDDIFYQSI